MKMDVFSTEILFLSLKNGDFYSANHFLDKIGVLELKSVNFTQKHPKTTQTTSKIPKNPSKSLFSGLPLPLSAKVRDPKIPVSVSLKKRPKTAIFGPKTPFFRPKMAKKRLKTAKIRNFRVKMRNFRRFRRKIRRNCASDCFFRPKIR
jgi:hypothetical protein